MNKNLQKRITASINRVISDPSHAIISDNSNNLLYNEKMYTELANTVSNIINAYHLDNANIPEEIKILIINDYIKNNVKIRRSYFDAFEERIPEIPNGELIYRTAYGALIKGEAMCAGYTESIRILCEAVGIKTHTLLSKLPGKNKHLLHYVAIATTNDKSFILDPERETSCEKKGYDFHQYQMSMDYLTPTGAFFDNKIGKNGVGIDVFDYIQNSIYKNNKSSLFFIDDSNNVFVKTVNDEDPPQIKNASCKTLEKLLNNPKFSDFILEHKAVFMIHGTDNAKALSSIMDIAEKQYKNKINNPQLGE